MLTKDFKEFIELLNAKKVEYLLVGGYAVILHRYPRFTGDIDFWINPASIYPPVQHSSIQLMPGVFVLFPGF
jgi:hypothetical protein